MKKERNQNSLQFTKGDKLENYFNEIKNLLDSNKWIAEFLSGQGYCIICDHDDPLDFENHHVAGKHNNSLTVSLCRNCHGRVSRKQRYWSKRWTNMNNPQNQKDAFLMRGISDLLRLKAERTLNYE